MARFIELRNERDAERKRYELRKLEEENTDKQNTDELGRTNCPPGTRTAIQPTSASEEYFLWRASVDTPHSVQDVELEEPNIASHTNALHDVAIKKQGHSSEGLTARSLRLHQIQESNATQLRNSQVERKPKKEGRRGRNEEPKHSRSRSHQCPSPTGDPNQHSSRHRHRSRRPDGPHKERRSHHTGPINVSRDDRHQTHRHRQNDSGRRARNSGVAHRDRGFSQDITRASAARMIARRDNALAKERPLLLQVADQVAREKARERKFKTRRGVVELQDPEGLCPDFMILAV
ncbi:hypothetical protein DL96DRAFT_1562057 [Flagelloscypha sp. PMI_526]|nr:hypothetical protein DL96DRAFT_1562057 [Flagelloscypha sp. PMI_526]